MTLRGALILGVLTGAVLGAPPVEAQTTAEADVVLVEMIEESATRYVFEPARITVAPGQTVRFVQKGEVPHNVEFRDAPDGSSLDDVRMGPFLATAGETYEIEIDDRFPEGAYDYVCTPHVMMGMKGEIVVEGAGSPAQRE